MEALRRVGKKTGPRGQILLYMWGGESPVLQLGTVVRMLLSLNYGRALSLTFLFSKPLSLR